MSEDSLKWGPAPAFGMLRRGKTGLFSGPFKLRVARRLHSGWSGGTLSDGPKLIVEIPVSLVAWRLAPAICISGDGSTFEEIRAQAERSALSRWDCVGRRYLRILADANRRSAPLIGAGADNPWPRKGATCQF